MKTFTAWLIANIDVILNVVMIITLEVGVFTMQTDDGGKTIALAILGPILLVILKAILGGVPAKSFGGDVMNIITNVVGYAILLFYYHNTNSQYFTILTVGMSISLAVAVAVAVFTCNNIHEVVSRRMLYYNSNADMFGITWQYTINRFVATWSGLNFIPLVFIFLDFYQKGYMM